MLCVAVPNMLLASVMSVTTAELPVPFGPATDEPWLENKALRGSRLCLFRLSVAVVFPDRLVTTPLALLFILRS